MRGLGRSSWMASWLWPAVALAVAAVSLAACAEPPPADAGVPWRRVPPPADLPAGRPLIAGFLVVDGVYDTELTAPLDILHHTVFHTSPGIEVVTISPDGAAVTTFEGLRLTPDHGFDDAPPLDILVVPSAEHSMDTDLENETMLRWVAQTGRRARFVMSLCDGAFVLAAAGLLDGRRATTFPGDQDAFARRFPQVTLLREPTVVHDGPAITSVGGVRSFEPAMYLVDHLYGPEVARGVGRGMVIDWPPVPAMMRVAIAP